MPKKKHPADLNRMAASIVASATGETPAEDEGKNPHAVALGRAGGLKGGKARAKSLTKKRKVAIAKKAASARWKDR